MRNERWYKEVKRMKKMKEWIIMLKSKKEWKRSNKEWKIILKTKKKEGKRWMKKWNIIILKIKNVWLINL